MTPFPGYAPDWRWGTAEGSREFDRRLDRALTFREKLEWLEEAETLTLQLRASREAKRQMKSEESSSAEQGGEGKKLKTDMLKSGAGRRDSGR